MAIRKRTSSIEGECFERVEIFTPEGVWAPHPTRGNWAPCGTYRTEKQSGPISGKIIFGAQGTEERTFQPLQLVSLDDRRNDTDQAFIPSTGTVREDLPNTDRDSIPTNTTVYNVDGTQVGSKDDYKEEETDSKRGWIVAVVVLIVLAYVFRNSFK